MSYIKDIARKFGWEQEDFTGEHKVTVYGTDCVLVEGHRGIVTYESDEVGFRLKKSRLMIRGENLCIREINRDEAFVKGKIGEIIYG